MAKQPTDEKYGDSAASAPEAKPHCGIIMPISDSVGYDPGHWLEVRRLIVRAAEQVGYTAGMVSENDGQDVIHRSIVKNIYHNDLVVCDVSSLNPNVMLELGLRMANKKPLIVVFDGEGVYPFDIKNMLYIPYPKGLHHFKVETFVQELTARMVQVTEAAKANKYEPFLNHFNDVVIEESKLGTTTQSMAEMLANLVDEFKDFKAEVNTLRSGPTTQITPNSKSIIFSEKDIRNLWKIAKDTYAVNPTLDINTLVETAFDFAVSSLPSYAEKGRHLELKSRLLTYSKTAKGILYEALVQTINSGA